MSSGRDRTRDRSADRSADRARDRARDATIDRSGEALASSLEAMLAASGSREELLEGAAASYRTGELSAGGLAGLDRLLAGLSPLDPPQGTRLTEGAGEPVSPQVRASLEAVFGRSLDRIRVHADAEGAAVAHGLGAQAAASGRDIFVSSPAMATDLPLMGHEVAHVVAGTQAVALKKDRSGRRGKDGGEDEKKAPYTCHRESSLRPMCEDGRPDPIAELVERLNGDSPAKESATSPGPGAGGKPRHPFLDKIAPYVAKVYADPSEVVDGRPVRPHPMNQDGRADPLAALDDMAGELAPPDVGAADAKALLAKLDDVDRDYLRSEAGLSLLETFAALPEYHGLARFRLAWLATETERIAAAMEHDRQSQPWRDLFGDVLGGQMYDAIAGATDPAKMDEAVADAVAGQVDSYINRQIEAVAERAKTDPSYSQAQAAQDKSEWVALQAMMKAFVPGFVTDLMSGRIVKGAENGLQQFALQPEVFLVLVLALVSPVSTGMPGAEGTSSPIELLAGLPIDFSKLSFKVLKSSDKSGDLSVGADLGSFSANDLMGDPGGRTIHSLNAQGAFRFGNADARSFSLGGDATWNLHPDASSADSKKSSPVYGSGSLAWQDKKKGTLLGADASFDGKGISSASSKQQWQSDTDKYQFGQKYQRNDATGGFSFGANQSILNIADPKYQMHLTENLAFGGDGSLSSLNLSQKFQDKNGSATLSEGFSKTKDGSSATFELQAKQQKFDWFFKTELGNAKTTAGFGLTLRPQKDIAFDVKTAMDLLGPQFMTSFSTSLQIGNPETFLQTYLSYQRSNKPDLTVEDFTIAFRKSFGQWTLSGGASMTANNGKATSFNASAGGMWKGGQDGKSGFYGVADYDRSFAPGGMNDLTIGGGYWRNGVGVGPQVQLGDHAPIWGVGVRTDLDFLGKKKH